LSVLHRESQVLLYWRALANILPAACNVEIVN
jgi:hypothetical protein